MIDAQDLIATEEVLFELERKDDEVYEWALDRRKMFLPIDAGIQTAVQDILRDHPRLVDTRRSRSAADPFVIALAKVEEATVITQERATNRSDRPHIPDVCAAQTIRCIDLLQVIKEQNWIF